MPPTGDVPKKEYIRFAVSPEMLQDAMDLAELEGLSQAEFHRMVWTLGLNSYFELSNKRLVNKRLRQRTADD